MEMRKTELYKQFVAPKYTYSVDPDAPKIYLWPIFKNPGIREIIELKKCYNWQSSSYLVRGVVFKNGDVYAWPSEWLHEFMETDFPDMYNHVKACKLTFKNYKELKDILNKLEEMNWFENID